MRVLILGGTAEARDLAEALVGDGDEVLTSLAGRVARPRLPVGRTRIGGFGGAAALAAYARAFDAVVDATHPFAATISAHAAQVEVPLLRLARPGWDDPGDWHWVEDHDSAATVTAGLGQRPFLTIGRQSLGRFVEPLRHHDVLARVVDPPDDVLPDRWRLLLDRGPYDHDRERALMVEHRTDVLVTKDSGGSHTHAKLEVARERSVAIVVVARPGPPEGVSCVDDVDAARRWVRAR